METNSKQNYNKVIKKNDKNLIVFFRMFIMNITKRGREWIFSKNYYYPQED
jgi:hypothetical protein